jgi:phosphoglycerate dehydrogenase-like enzyme
LRYELPEAQIDVRLDLSPERLLALIGSYTVLILRSQTRVSDELLAKAIHLQVIGRAGSGLDNIDLDAAMRHGVLVVHAPRGNAIAVAEHTMALLLALVRHIPTATSSIKAGRWDKSRLLGVELHQGVLGILGLGRIGKEEVLQRADFVTLHATLSQVTSGTRRLLGSRELSLLKPGAYLVNCARGSLIDENALLSVLTEGRLAGVALDVFSQDELADFCDEHHLWLHVDGAYGGFGILDPHVSHLYTGLSRADSIALDPHKWLATPIECSCAIVRQGTLLRETFSLVPPYLQAEPDKGFGGMLWFSEYGFQQTRRFNALKLLWVIQQAGRTGLVAHVERHNTLAQYVASLVDDVPNLELMAPVELSIVCFRYVPDLLRGDEGQLDALNKRIMEEVQAGGKAFVNGTNLHDRFVLRSCALHYALTEDDVVAIIEEVCRIGERCVA